jgi:GntR family transcriptional regulator, transcriptional repressor for pyruvate dehydrogenase complex
MIERKRVSHQIMDEIKEKIRSGYFSPHSKLPSENELAKMFNVSRVPVREALSALASHGIIDSRHGNGSWVLPFPMKGLLNKHLVETVTFDQIIKLLETRMILETQAAALAALRHNESDLEKIYNAQEILFNEINDISKVSNEADYSFHRAIFQSTKNEVLIQVLDNLSEIYYLAMKTSLSINTKIQGKKKQVYEEHQAILKAISTKNPLKAEEAMELHLENSREKLLKYKDYFVKGVL